MRISMQKILIIELFIFFATCYIFKRISSRSCETDSLRSISGMFTSKPLSLTKYDFAGEYPVTNTDYDVSMITQTSILRLFYFQYLLTRWKGPMVVTVYLPKDDVDAFNGFLHDNSIPERLHFIRYNTPDPSIYPYNKLRNIAIQRVVTSHFWVADMDMWPSENTYQVLRSLPEQILSNDFMAIIVPAFEYKKLKNCNDFIPCVNKVIPHVPKTKPELLGCIEQKLCQQFRPTSWVHDYLTPNWYKEDIEGPIQIVPCFRSVKQEPYIMVKRSPYLPPFDERFINYGKDKISWIEHVRYSGYMFAVVKDAFAIDIPHPRSALANVFFDKILNHGGMSSEMNVLWLQFKKELRDKYPDKSVTFICDEAGKDY